MSNNLPRGEEYARLLLVTIREVREEHHACTLRELARRLGGVNHNIINRQFDILRKAELVDATEMPGSLHLTAKGGKVASGGKMPELQTPKVRVRTAGDAPPEVPESPWPPPPPSSAPADMRSRVT